MHLSRQLSRLFALLADGGLVSAQDVAHVLAGGYCDKQYPYTAIWRLRRALHGSGYEVVSRTGYGWLLRRPAAPESTR